MKISPSFFTVVLLLASISLALSQNTPPWSNGSNAPAEQRGYIFRVPDVDNVPDLHGNPTDAKLVIFIGGNQFFVLPQLITAFERHHPKLRGHIFYETLPPGVLQKQIAADNAITLGNLTIQIKPDVYEAGTRVLHEMEQHGQLNRIVEYATNDLEIMVAAGNPKGIRSLTDLGRPDIRLSMPSPQSEGLAKQIATSLRKEGGKELYQSVYEHKVKDGETVLTEIHHRQTPMRIMNGQADAGVTWSSEVRFQQSIGNPIQGIVIPANRNTTAIYAAGMMAHASHARAAWEWLSFLRGREAQAIYRKYGFRSISDSFN
jgi:ABC-type molybdate transport system substrate-binding protein